MKRIYEVSKNEKGIWYVHKAGYPWIPVMGSGSKSKRAAQKYAADLMAISLKEYLALPK